MVKLQLFSPGVEGGLLDNRALNLPRLGVSPKECKVERWSTGQTRSSLARFASCSSDTSPVLWYCSNQCLVGLINSSLRNHKHLQRVTRCDVLFCPNKRLVGRTRIFQRVARWLNEWISLQTGQPVLRWPSFRLARCPISRDRASSVSPL